ncbi:MAG: hypothetical protein IKO98_07645, partial [Bacteroidales bacterium]|nr:hypothetical protein [Bacteroidales bacterium]
CEKKGIVMSDCLRVPPLSNRRGTISFCGQIAHPVLQLQVDGLCVVEIHVRPPFPLSVSNSENKRTAPQPARQCAMGYS